MVDSVGILTSYCNALFYYVTIDILKHLPLKKLENNQVSHKRTGDLMILSFHVSTFIGSLFIVSTRELGDDVDDNS